MQSIIQLLLTIIQYQQKQIHWLLLFIAKYIPLKQWAFDQAHSPKYQKFKTDELPKLVYSKQEWTFAGLQSYYKQRYGKDIPPVKRHRESDIPDDCSCPCCKAPMPYLYKNNGSKGQLLCKVCSTRFSPDENRFTKHSLRCPHCNRSLVHKRDRKFFRIHSCLNPNCAYYLNNLKKVDKLDLADGYQRSKYKLHYIYREFTLNFFKMDLDSLPKNASSLTFRKQNAHVMSLCLTFRVNLGLSLRKTSQALRDLYNISVSHTMIDNYAKTAAVVIKPFVDLFPYPDTNTMTADETYIKVRGVKGYIWLIIDAISRSIIGYQASDNRGVGPCILAMRMAFRRIKQLPDNFKFITDGYSAYPLAAQQFALKDNPLHFDVTQVIGLTNDDEVSKKFRPQKQIIERLNRTFKASYRPTCGYDTLDGANRNLALWVAYYNFLRPHKSKNYQPLNHIQSLSNADNMPAKWQILISLGQQTILNLQKHSSAVI